MNEDIIIEVGYVIELDNHEYYLIAEKAAEDYYRLIYIQDGQITEHEVMGTFIKDTFSGNLYIRLE